MSRIVPVEDVGSSAMKIRLDLAILIAGGWGTISVRLRRISAVDGVRLALCPLCISTAPFVPQPSLVMDFSARPQALLRLWSDALSIWHGYQEWRS